MQLVDYSFEQRLDQTLNEVCKVAQTLLTIPYVRHIYSHGKYFRVFLILSIGMCLDKIVVFV